MVLTLIPGGAPPVQPRSTRSTDQCAVHGTNLRQIGWIPYPNGFGRLFQATEFPRLTYLMRSLDGGERRDAYWLVDGQTVESIDAAVEALAEPPKLSPLEAEVLELVPTAWTEPASLRAAVTADLPTEAHGPRVRVLRALADKGLIEIGSNRIRRSSGGDRGGRALSDGSPFG